MVILGAVLYSEIVKVVRIMPNRFPHSTIKKYEALGYFIEESSTLEEMSWFLGLSIPMVIRHLKKLHKEKRIVLDRDLVRGRPTEEFYYLYADENAYQNYINMKEAKKKLIEDRRIRRNRRRYRKRIESKLLNSKMGTEI
jgi:predicted ArsR family transcriptional regulator